MPVDDQLVAAFSQSSGRVRRNLTIAPGMGVQTFATDYASGVCSGLVQVWCSLKLGEVQDTASRRSPTDRIEALYANTGLAVAIHQGGTAIGGGLDQRVSGNDRLNLVEQVLLSRYAADGHTLDAASTAVQRSSKRSCFHLAVRIQRGQSGGNHSLGIYLSAGKMGLGLSRHAYLFDPNHGEYKIDEGVLLPWLQAFFTEKYPGVTVRVLELVSVSLTAAPMPQA